MSRARFSFFLMICMLSCVWGSCVFVAEYVRLKHPNLIASIRAGAAIKPRVIDSAIAGYTHALRWFPCDAALHKERLLLLAKRSDISLMDSQITTEDKALEETQDALVALLSCMPMDGKAWLDFAMVNTYREGFSMRALDAYKMSAAVAPGESWLAEKRLLFALHFRPLLDTQAQQLARDDLAVLERAHPNRTTAVMKEAAVDSKEDLDALFATQGH